MARRQALPMEVSGNGRAQISRRGKDGKHLSFIQTIHAISLMAVTGLCLVAPSVRRLISCEVPYRELTVRSCHFSYYSSCSGQKDIHKLGQSGSALQSEQIFQLTIALVPTVPSQLSLRVRWRPCSLRCMRVNSTSSL
jgi:hypothetical protein